MKKLFLFLLLCSLGFSQYNTQINFELLEERDGLYYQYNSPKPFSGKVFNIEGLSEGSFRNGKKSGMFSFYYDNGQLESQGYYSNNLQQRKWTHYYENGQLNGTGSYKDGDGTDLGNSGVPRHGRTGKWKFYHDNGQLSQEGTWKDGKPDGPHKWYYENGQLKEEGNSKDGKRDGPHKWYYDNGQLSEEGTYKDGKPDGPYRWYYDNGQLQEEITYKNGQLNGPYKSYYENGQLQWEYYFNTDGTRDGTKKTKRWYDNGQLNYEGYVITVDGENIWNGPYKSYYENGQLKKEETYFIGELIESVFFDREGQKIGVHILENTKWMLYEDDGDIKVMTFQSDGTFEYTVKKSDEWGEGMTYDDYDDTWTLEGNNLIISYTNGYMIKNGTLINNNFIKGTYENVKGLKGTWYGELIE